MFYILIHQQCLLCLHLLLTSPGRVETTWHHHQTCDHESRWCCDENNVRNVVMTRYAVTMLLTKHLTIILIMTPSPPHSLSTVGAEPNWSSTETEMKNSSQWIVRNKITLPLNSEKHWVIHSDIWIKWGWGKTIVCEDFKDLSKIQSSVFYYLW